MTGTFTEFDVSDSRKLRNSLNNLEEKVSASIYREQFQPEDFALQGSATLALASTTNTPYVNFVTGTSDQAAVANFFVEDYWVIGSLYVRVFYSGDNTTNNYSVRVRVNDYSVGGDITTTGSVLDNDAVPVVTSANELMTPVDIGPFSVDANDRVISVLMKRRGATDTNAGNFFLLGIRMRFYATRV